jgi:hypothetical protein
VLLLQIINALQRIRDPASELVVFNIPAGGTVDACQWVLYSPLTSTTVFKFHHSYTWLKWSAKWTLLTYAVSNYQINAVIEDFWILYNYQYFSPKLKN